jgi:hypothetical protein
VAGVACCWEGSSSRYRQRRGWIRSWEKGSVDTDEAHHRTLSLRAEHARLHSARTLEAHSSESGLEQFIADRLE